MSIHAFSARYAVGLALGLVLSASPAVAQVKIGSFVSGERPMYLEIDQLVEGKSYDIKFMNVPPGSTEQTLFFSTGYFPADMSAYNIPGYMGPDGLYGGFILVNGNEYTGVATKGLSGHTFYVQGYVKTPTGGRLTSMVETHPQASSSGSGGTTFPLPLTTQEVLPYQHAGYDRVGQPVRVGLPFPKGSVTEKNGVPQLTLTGGPTVGQFSTLASWSDGSVKWALCEYEKDLTANTIDTSVAVDHGSGNFGGSSLATTSGTVTTVNTGPLVFTSDSAKDDLFQSFQLNGREVFSTTAGNKPRFWDDTDVEWTWHKLGVSTRRNGPVRAELEIDGMFTRSSAPTDVDRIYVRIYVEAFLNQSSIRATVSLRDTALSFPQHLLFRGFTWQAVLNETGPFDVTGPSSVKNGGPSTTVSGSIGSGEDASFFQGYARRTDWRLDTDPNATPYKPFIQRNGNDNFALAGESFHIGSNFFTGDSTTNWFSAVTEFADPAFLQVDSSGSGRGVLFGIEHAAKTWPVSYSAFGDGTIEVALLPHKAASDTHNYPLTYMSAETRVFYVVAESKPAANPIAVAACFDYPLAARTATWAYNQSDAWPWRLTTPAEMLTYCGFAGLRTPNVQIENPVKTLYRFAGGTGGGNNNWGETQLFYQWIRSGAGGSYLNSWFETIYKADKMAASIDDGALKDRQKIVNPKAPVTPIQNCYDGSKHTFFQSVHDWAFTRGETYLLDSAKHFADTVMDKGISPNVQPYGNFVPGTYGAVTNAAAAILDMEPNQALEDWLHLVEFQWSNVVFQQSNNFGVKTATLGWQAPLGTPEGSSTNPDGYMITWSAGKSSDKAKYGYLAELWTDLRMMSLSYKQYVHHLADVDPTDSLIGDLTARAPDIYHFARRGLPDDHCKFTGEYYNTDVFAGDANNPNVDPLSPPGPYITSCNPSGYSLQSIVNFLLDMRQSETAFSYGVELHRSMSDPTFNKMVNDPVLNDFVRRYLVHYGLVQP